MTADNVRECRRFAGLMASMGRLELLEMTDAELARVLAEAGVNLPEAAAALANADRIMRAVSETAIRH